MLCIGLMWAAVACGRFLKSGGRAFFCRAVVLRRLARLTLCSAAPSVVVVVCDVAIPASIVQKAVGCAHGDPPTLLHQAHTLAQPLLSQFSPHGRTWTLFPGIRGFRKNEARFLRAKPD